MLCSDTLDIGPTKQTQYIKIFTRGYFGKKLFLDFTLEL